MIRSFCVCVGLSAAAFPSIALAADPWADVVRSYSSGSGASTDYMNSNVVLGSPERFTGETTPFGPFPGAVTPFNTPFGTDEIVSIGAGGSLVVSFDEPVMNDAQNPFGVDLLVFGNAFFWDPVNFTPTAQVIGSDGGLIEVSQDGFSWTPVPATDADGLFPTLGYSDLTDPFGGPAGNVITDFTRPVDPSFAWQGLGLTDLIAGYNGSGGGTGVDIGALGLPWITHVRISLPAGSAGNIEIDAFSDVTAVPAPGCLVLLGISFSVCRRRRAGDSGPR